MAIIDLLAPIFLIIALGAGLQRGGLLPPAVIAGVNQLLYWVGLPVAVFHSLAVAEHTAASMGAMLTVLLIATGLNVGLAWGTAAAMRVQPAARGTFVQAAYRGNLSFIGLPLLLTVPGVPTAPAVLAMAPMLIVYNAVAVTVLLASRHAVGVGMWRPIAREIARNPIIIASLLGAAFYLADGRLPVALDLTLGALARMALPLALLTIGGALMTVPLRGNRAAAVAASIFKVAVSPLVGYAVGRWFGLSGPEMLAVLLFMTCPSAAISYTMVKQMGGDEGVAASAIVISAVLSVPALVVVLALFAV